MRHLFHLILSLLLIVPTSKISAIVVDGINYRFDGSEAVVISDYPNYSGDIVIPSSVNYQSITYTVTAIDEYAFQDCSGLTSVIIPNSVTTIGERAFAYCSGLNSIVVNAGNTVYDSRNNCNAIIKTASNTLMQGCKNTIIPNSVTSIGGGAFAYCSGLTAVIIPNSVTSIGGGAFSRCNGLTSVTIPNSVTSIGGEAFQGCSGLNSITMGAGVKVIGYDAFEGCSNLQKVIIRDLSAWCNIFFYGLSNYGYGNFSNPLLLAQHLYSNENIEITDLVIPNDVTQINNIAFYGCRSFTSVTIGNNVKAIGDYAFYHCNGLSSVTISNSVTTIGEWAFYGCSGLNSITIPNSVTSMGRDAFSGCI